MSERKYNVYLLTAPNSKRYVGYTSHNPAEIFNGGEYFATLADQTFFKDILQFGWQNVSCSVLYTGLDYKTALVKKQELCQQYKTYMPECGYNSKVSSGVKSNPTSENKYSVYIHIVPNGKAYVGQYKNSTRNKWGINGNNYQSNKSFIHDIQKYGWDNIAHVVICDTLSKKQADYLESYLIRKYQTKKQRFGYNNDIYNNANKDSIKYSLMYYLIREFLDNDETLKSTLIHFLYPYSASELCNMYDYTKENQSKIKRIIENRTFDSNRKKAIYLLSIINSNSR